jgi:two-component system NarL family sensor kinase
MERLRILNAVAEALNSAPDAQQALARTLSLVTDFLGLKTGWVWLLDAETGQFYSATAQNLPPYLQEPVRMTGSSCWCLSLFRAGKLTPTNVDLIECSRLHPAVRENAAGETLGLCYHASIPLYFQDRPLGVMNVAAPAWRELSADELSLLSTIAYQAGIAVERARLAEESLRLARAEERSRFAREIHDTLAQDLTAILLHLESALKNVDPHPERAKERIRQALETAQGSLEEARRSVMNLRAAPLAGRSLKEALNALSRAFTSDTGIRAFLRIADVPSLSLRTEAELFRIVQEALANVRRHSNATEVRIVLQSIEERIELTIEDDGQGFDPQAVPARSQGIVGMRERAALLNGTLHLTGPPGGGVKIAVSIPLTEATHDSSPDR